MGDRLGANKNMKLKIPFSRTIKHVWDYKTQVRQFKKEKWFFSEIRTNLYIWERVAWEKFYAPINLTGKTVLDVGAGEGESAYFFLKHGAKRVVCVEPWDEAYANLELNAKFHKEIVPIFKAFSLDDLKIPDIDFAKIDIEGYEEILVGQPKPSFAVVVELHGLQLRDRFREAGFWKIDCPFNGGSEWFNYIHMATYLP